MSCHLAVTSSNSSTQHANMHNTKNEDDTGLYIKVVGLLSGIVEILAILIYTGVFTMI